MHYYKLNIADWHLGTAHLSMAEECTYFRLINFYYDTELPIPLDTQWVARRLRLESEEIARAILQEFFTSTEKGWVHEVCEKNLMEYRKTAKKNRKNGMMGGRPRITRATEKPSGLPVGTESDASGNPNHKPITTNHNKNKNTSSNPEGFDAFWAAYPRKVGKKDAMRAYSKLKPDTQLQSDLITDIKNRLTAGAWNLLDKDYIPHPSTYLNAERWNDEITPRGNSNGTNQSAPANPGKLTPAQRVRARQAEAAAAGSSVVDAVDAHVRDVRPHLGEPTRR